jgi:hypothetical protein
VTRDVVLPVNDTDAAAVMAAEIIEPL